MFKKQLISRNNVIQIFIFAPHEALVLHSPPHPTKLSAQNWPKIILKFMTVWINRIGQKIRDKMIIIKWNSEREQKWWLRTNLFLRIREKRIKIYSKNFLGEFDIFKSKNKDLRFLNWSKITRTTHQGSLNFKLIRFRSVGISTFQLKTF